ncbi:MAG: hypothetical protein K1X39_01150 [Thermoflexales bacterium]|nr:hypothetical protein [Thermoflexales bacterium]
MIDFVLWYLWMQAFGFASVGITRRWLGGLPDRGYGASKALGILLGGFAYWACVTLGLAANNSGAPLLALAIVALVSVLVHLRSGERLALNLRRVPAAVWWTEAVFLIAFAACALFRSYVPEITEAGGEKYMESMFINAILRSPSFPPNDAWLSGYPISYYYFGYVLLAMLTRVSGIAPSIAFNLGGAMFFALALVTAFSVGFNLFGLRLRHAPAGEEAAPRRETRPYAAGLLTAIMLGVMGNLGGLMGLLRCGNTLPTAFWQWLDVRQIATKTTNDVCTQGVPGGFFYNWWWDWSRVVKDLSVTSTAANPQPQEVITETPIFSYILGDNHPHVMGLPFTLLALLVALAYLSQPILKRGLEVEFGIGEGRLKNIPLELPIGNLGEIALTAILAGGLSFMNTWDFPVFGGLIALALIAGRALRRESLSPAVLFSLAVFVIGYILYLPFYATFASQAKGLMVNLLNGTKFHQFFLIFAPFLIAAIGFVIATAEEWRLGAGQLLGRAARLGLIGLGGALLLGALVGVTSSMGRQLLADMTATGNAQGVTAAAIQRRLTERINPFDPAVAGPWTPLLLLILVSVCGVLAWRVLGPRLSGLTRKHDSVEQLDAGRISPLLFVLSLFMVGALVTVAVEFVYLLDNFGTRMNTVFKFYFQGWTMWAVAAGFAIPWLLGSRRWLTRGIAMVALLFVGFGLLWPVFAGNSRTDGYAGTPTLDGAAYLTSTHPDDARLIEWINANVQGAPVIVEAPGKGYASYTYNGRISAFTGLPTLLGWGGHQSQWRGNYTVPGQREPQIERLYTLVNDDNETRRILRQYNIDYVVVGDAERALYKPEGLAKFDRLCAVAVRTGNATLYACK